MTAERPADTGPPFACVVFDCDSTLSTIEGIDELAGDRAEEIAALTARAMAGEVALEEVYGARLALLRPSRDAVARVAELYLARALPHAAELVAALRALDKRVAVVSGGLREAVLPFARAIGVDADLVRAVPVRFDEAGAYAGFDDASPLARSGGKPAVVADLVAPCRPGRAALVGDGVTDLEAAREVERFVAFAGVADRPAVTGASHHVVRRADLAALVPILFTAEERAALAASGAHDALLAAAEGARP